MNLFKRIRLLQTVRNGIIQLFHIVHCCIDIEDRSLSGLYFNKIILSYLTSVCKWFNHLSQFKTILKFLFNNNKYFSNFFNWIQVAIHSGYDNCISVAIYVSFTFISLLLIYNNSETRRSSAKASRQELIIRCDIRLFSLKTELHRMVTSNYIE
jgi:hypothetical protein